MREEVKLDAEKIWQRWQSILQLLRTQSSNVNIGLLVRTSVLLLWLVKTVHERQLRSQGNMITTPFLKNSRKNMHSVICLSSSSFVSPTGLIHVIYYKLIQWEVNYYHHIVNPSFAFTKILERYHSLFNVHRTLSLLSPSKALHQLSRKPIPWSGTLKSVV